MKKKYGITLIELLLALVLSTILMGIVASIYLSAKKNFERQANLSDMQENARMAIALLKSKIHLAGYMGCAKLTDQFPIKNYPPYIMNAKNKITISSNKLTILYANKSHANLIHAMTHKSILYVSKNSLFAVGDILIISNCQMAELFKIKHIALVNGLQKITTIKPLTTNYQPYAEVSRFEKDIYFIDKTQRTTSRGDPIYGLFVTHLQQPETELFPDITEMKLKKETGGVFLELNVSSQSEAHQIWYSYIAI